MHKTLMNTFNPYKVIAYSSNDGLLADAFASQEEAEHFAEDIVLEGYEAGVLHLELHIDANDALLLDDIPAESGIDFPYTLHASQLRSVLD